MYKVLGEIKEDREIFLQYKEKSTPSNNLKRIFQSFILTKLCASTALPWTELLVSEWVARTKY